LHRLQLTYRGDYAFASERGSFDAAGGRFSISVDRNPFTAKYWYEKAMLELPNAENDQVSNNHAFGVSTRYLKNAQEASNPGSRAYRYEATLRRGDLEFLEGLRTFQAAKLDDMVVVDAAISQLKTVQTIYTKKSAKYLNEDYGKPHVDQEAYFKSFLYHVQALILAGKEEQAIALCAARGQIWGKSINVLEGSNGSYNQWMQLINYLHAFALYKGDLTTEAKELIQNRLSENSLARYILGHAAFLDGLI